LCGLACPSHADQQLPALLVVTYRAAAAGALAAAAAVALQEGNEFPDAKKVTVRGSAENVASAKAQIKQVRHHTACWLDVINDRTAAALSYARFQQLLACLSSAS
jgi:sugar (pentulose or hexulose) kinase